MGINTTPLLKKSLMTGSPQEELNIKKKCHTRGNKLLSADFGVGNNFIEYFGLNGVISEYKKLIKEKRKLSKKYKFPLIEIYPKDLFPINHLSEIIRIKNI